jgi:hypothetical protein
MMVDNSQFRRWNEEGSSNANQPLASIWICWIDELVSSASGTVMNEIKVSNHFFRSYQQIDFTGASQSLLLGEKRQKLVTRA